MAAQRSLRPGCHDTINDSASYVYRSGESQAKIAIASADADKSCVDADKLAAPVDEGATEVPWIDGAFRLDEIFVSLDAEIVPMQPANDPRADGVCPIRNGLPIASTKSPTSIASESPSGTLVHLSRIEGLIFGLRYAARGFPV